MKSAEEILRDHSLVCPKFPDPKCVGCICNADLAAIRAAQIEAAEYVRTAAAKVMDDIIADAEEENEHSGLIEYYCEKLIEIRSIKLPGDGA